jgi:transcription factor SFP1
MAYPTPNNDPSGQSQPIPGSGQWSGMHQGGGPGRSFPKQSSFQSVRWANGPPSIGTAIDSMQGTDPSFGQAYVDDELARLMCRTNIPNHNSVASNPHSGVHPASFGPNFHFSAAALGSSSIGSSSMGMSMSPPRWHNQGQGWGGPGSFVGSLGGMGSSFGRDRDREMEARYVRDFSCCGKQLGGLHELLEQ